MKHMITIRRVALFAALVSPLAGLAILVLFEFRHSLREWQTLMAGGLALVAAFIGAIMIQRQINATAESDHRKVARQFDAERALLPHALHRFSQYTTDSFVVLDDLLSQCRAGFLPGGYTIKPLPRIPRDGVESFRRLISTADSEDIRLYLALILNKIQVQNARLLGLLDRSKRRFGMIYAEIDLEIYTVDTAEIQALVSELYDFARRDNHKAPSYPSYRCLRSQLDMAGFDDSTRPKMYEHAQKRAGKYGRQ